MWVVAVGSAVVDRPPLFTDLKLNALERSLRVAQHLNGDDDMLCISDHPHLTAKTSELQLPSTDNAPFGNI